VTATFVPTPDIWFDLPGQAAACAAAGESLELTLTDAAGRRPLGDVSLDELQAIHFTFGLWWHTLGGDLRPASLRAGAYDQFLADSRALLRETAEAVLAGPGGTKASTPALVTFPPLDHVLLADPQRALLFFRSFLDVPHSPSLVAWSRAQSTAGAVVVQGAARAWLRVVLQKMAVEDDLAEAMVCLRAVYADDVAREELLRQESQLLEQCDLKHRHEWARALGLARTGRREAGIRVPRPSRQDPQREPDVTVLVPSYCHEAFIETALESVLAQTHPAFRLLVVDDCSSDGTVERASRIHDPRLRIEVNEQTVGLADSVLRAVDTVATPYVALLNSDDLFHHERLERCTAVLRDSERIDVVATGVVPIDAAGCHLAPANVRRLFDGANVADWIHWFYGAGDVGEGADLLLELLEHNFLVTSSNIVCRTGFLRSHRDVLHGLKYCLDWQLFLDAAIDGALAYVPEELVGYRLHTSNTMWFDDARRVAYAVEVNRVLACTLRRIFEASSAPRRDARQLAALLDRLTSRAMKHSHANAFLLYAVNLLGARTLEQTASRSDAVRTCLAQLSHANHAAAVAPGGDVELRTESDAARVLAGVWREEAAVARGAEQWAREELRRTDQQIGRLCFLPGWLRKLRDGVRKR